MFKLAKSGSISFRILSWLFVGALFCDVANIDDLFRGVVALHDDFEVGAVSAGGLAGLPSIAGPCTGVPGMTTLGNVPVAPAAVRIVVDQDSPSIEARGLRSSGATMLTLRGTPRNGDDTWTSSELLHIRFRHLLI